MPGPGPHLLNPPTGQEEPPFSATSTAESATGTGYTKPLPATDVLATGADLEPYVVAEGSNPARQGSGSHRQLGFVYDDVVMLPRPRDEADFASRTAEAFSQLHQRVAEDHTCALQAGQAELRHTISVLKGEIRELRHRIAHANMTHSETLQPAMRSEGEGGPPCASPRSGAGVPNEFVPPLLPQRSYSGAIAPFRGAPKRPQDVQLQRPPMTITSNAIVSSSFLERDASFRTNGSLPGQWQVLQGQRTGSGYEAASPTTTLNRSLTGRDSAAPVRSSISGSFSFMLWSCWEEAKNYHEIDVHSEGSWSVNEAVIDECYNLDVDYDHKKSMRKRKTRCIMRPSHILRIMWDILGIVALVWDVVTIPLQVFDLPESRVLELLAIITMSYWSGDILFTFLVGYYNDKGVLVMDPWQIACRYLRTWFTPDVCIATFDLLTVIETEGGGALDSIGIMRFGKAFRFLRIVRILRLFRLRKIRVMLAYIQDTVDSEGMSIGVSILKNLVGVMMVNHFIACVWYWIGTMDIKGFNSWISAHDIEDKPWLYRYLTAFHWSITQFTPASMDVQPHTVPERAYALAVILLAMVMFSSFVSSVTNGMNRLWGLKAKETQELWLFRKYLRQNEVSPGLTERLNRYIQVVLDTQQREVSRHDIRIIDFLSEPLHDELQYEIFIKHVEVHPFFARLRLTNPAVVRVLCSRVIAQKSLSQLDVLFTAGEKATCMYFMSSGLMLYFPTEDGSVPVPLYQKQWCCEAVLWTPWKHYGTMRAKLECELFTVEATKFQDAVTQHHGNPLFPVMYSVAFVNALNDILHEEAQGNFHISDIHIDIVHLGMVKRVLDAASGPIEMEVKSSKTNHHDKEPSLQRKYMQSRLFHSFMHDSRGFGKKRQRK